MKTENIIRLLTVGALAGLLFTIGLRLTAAQIIQSLRRSRFGLILLVNFLAVPALTTALALVFNVSGPIATAMILLAAAPFAPVVPIFARLARADLPLAAGLTAVFPFACALLTPIVCLVALRFLPPSGDVQLSVPTILLTLIATIIIPLGAGIALQRVSPALGDRLLRPVEVVGEMAGAGSLVFVVVTELPAILATGWQALLAMIVVSEIAMVMGYLVGGPAPASRHVVAFGTANRNIALALLVALASFPGTPVVPAVVANGLVLILLGLVHVAWWRFVTPTPTIS